MIYGCTVERVRAPVPGLPPALAGLTLGALSDAHVGYFSGPGALARAVARLNRLHPDLAVFLGDLVHFHAGRRAPAAARALATLQAPLGAYAVLGNHDYLAGAGAVTRALMASGVTVLRNAGVLLRHRGAALWLAGAGSARAGDADLARALAGRPPGVPAVLLWHEPDLAPQADARGVGLQVSGHSHGGQICLPGGGLIAGPRLGRVYARGLQPVGARGMHVYTSRGLGLTGPPIRLFCPAEITLLELVPAPPGPPPHRRPGN